MFSARLLSLLVAYVVAMLYFSLLYPLSYALAQNPTTDPDSPSNNQPQYPDPDNAVPPPPDTVVDPDLPSGTFIPPQDGGGPVIVPPPPTNNSGVFLVIASIVVIGVAIGAIALHKYNKPRTTPRTREIPPTAVVEIRTKGGMDR